MSKLSEQQETQKCCQILTIIMKIPNMAKIAYREMPAPRDLPKQIPPGAKIRMQKPQSGANFRCKSPAVRGGDGYGKKLIAALPGMTNLLIQANLQAY